MVKIANLKLPFHRRVIATNIKVNFACSYYCIKNLFNANVEPTGFKVSNASSTVHEGYCLLNSVRFYRVSLSYG